MVWSRVALNWLYFLLPLFLYHPRGQAVINEDTDSDVVLLRQQIRALKSQLSLQASLNHKLRRQSALATRRESMPSSPPRQSTPPSHDDPVEWSPAVHAAVKEHREAMVGALRREAVALQELDASRKQLTIVQQLVRCSLARLTSVGVPTTARGTNASHSDPPGPPRGGFYLVAG